MPLIRGPYDGFPKASSSFGGRAITCSGQHQCLLGYDNVSKIGRGITMLKHDKAVALIAVLGMTAVGCSEFGNGEWDKASPESQGYRWVGEGEPANFGGAYSFCRQTLRMQTQGARLQGGSGILTTQGGGETTIPGHYQTGQSTRSDIVDRRQFQGCMEAQGWRPTGAAQSEPLGQSTNPARPPSSKPPSQ